METVDSLEDGNCFEPKLLAASKPCVTLKDGFDVSELNNGLSFEVKEKFRDDDDNENQPSFFDTEELFHHLNYECIDGRTDSDTSNDTNESPFTTMKRKMTAITEDEGVHKYLVKMGTGQIVTPGAICRVHYNGYVEYQDEPFDSTRLRSNQTQIKLGESNIRGLDTAIATMRKGELSRFIFSPDYAYKKMGCPPRIPPNSSVMFEIELVSFIDQTAADEFAEFSSEERNKASFESILKVTLSFKETGNDLFKRSNFFQAIKKYDKGIHLLERCRLKEESEEKLMNEALLLLYLNASLCSLRLGQGIRARKYGRKALDIDPKNIKAIFRIALGFQKEGELSKAREWFLRSQRQEPNNPDVREALLKLEKEVKLWKTTQKQMCERMFPNPSPASIETSSTNEKVEEKPPTTKPDEIQSLMIKRLQDFQNDENRGEIFFPSSLTTKEVDFLVEEAKGMGLHPVPPPSNKTSHLKITKEK